MKKNSRIKGMLVLMLGMLVAIGMFGMTAFADDMPESSDDSPTPASINSAKGDGDIILTGVCGPNENQGSLTWEFNFDTGVVRLSGSGEMAFSPWNTAWRPLIKVVHMPCNVTSLPENAFSDCVNLENMTFYGGDGERKLKKIGKRAFANCTTLDNNQVANLVARPVEEIGEEAFSDCVGLTELTMYSYVKKIGRNAFSGCTRLTKATLGENVEEIGVNAFAGCTSLSRIDVPGENQYFSSDDGVLFNKDKTTLIACPTTKGSFTIPDTVTRIDEYAFYGCKNLTYLEIPASVTHIGQDAFSGCSSLQAIRFLGSVPEFHPFAFGGLTTIVRFPGGDESWTDEVLQGYSGTITWKPDSVNLSGCTVIPMTINCSYTGQPIEPTPSTVMVNGKRLTKDKDYTISYKNNVNVGMATMILTGNFRYSGVREVTFMIMPAEVEIPSGQTLTYNGEVQEGIAKSDCYTATGNTATDAGTYTATLSIGSNYMWSDESVTDKEVTWTINPAVLDVPSGKTLTYTGKEQTGVAAGTGYDIDGNVATDAGAYTATLTLQSKTNYKWSDESTTDKEVTWTINPAVLDVPSGKTLTYTGKEQTGVAAGTGYDIDGNAATDAGTYTATLTLQSKTNYKWSDESTTDKEVTWTIDPAVLDAPSGKTLTYTGKKQTGVAAGTGYDIVGNAASDAGAYTATLTLQSKTNYTWSDGTTDDVTIGWKINKAANPLKIKAKTAKVKYAKVKKKAQTLAVSKVIAFTKKGQGAMTYTISSVKKGGKSFKGKITINKTTGKVTVKKGLKKGVYKVKAKAKAAGNKNYKPSAVQEVTFTVKVR